MRTIKQIKNLVGKATALLDEAISDLKEGHDFDDDDDAILFLRDSAEASDLSQDHIK